MIKSITLIFIEICEVPNSYIFQYAYILYVTIEINASWHYAKFREMLIVLAREEREMVIGSKLPRYTYRDYSSKEKKRKKKKKLRKIFQD